MIFRFSIREWKGRMKIAVLGGAFNPLHIGHCMLAESVVKDLGYKRVLFVPTNIPPHKKMASDVSGKVRLEMVQRFCDESSVHGAKAFFCEACEIDRAGISYTYDTICYLSEKYKEILSGKIGLVLGEESAAQFFRWHEAEKIASLVDFLVARRHPDGNGIDVDSFENETVNDYQRDFQVRDFKETFRYSHTMLENPVLPVSSTEIRSRIARAKAFRYLVPESVFQYIMEHKLYGFR